MHSMYAGIRNGSQSFMSNGGPASTTTPKPKLIGLTAPARAGKDTIGDMLSKHFNSARVAFAAPLRSALRAMIPDLTDEHFFGSLKEVPLDWLGKSPRQLMQTLGTEWGRNLIHSEIWLKLAERAIDKYHSQQFHVVVTDVRFENEAHFIRQKGGQIWHIRRGDAPKVNAHASEAGVQVVKGDLIIDNNGSLDQLEGLVIHAFTN